MHRFVWLALLVACEAGVQATQTGDDDFVDEEDEVAPEIDHEPISTAQPFGEDISVAATVTDDGDGVFMVTLYYKNENAGEADWRTKTMVAQGDLYTGTIPGEDHHSGGVHYYIEASDKAQNVASEPDEGADDPHHIRLYE